MKGEMNTMKELFVPAFAEIILFRAQDVITASGEPFDVDDPSTPGGEPEP